MASVVTQKIHIEAVSDDLSCKTIIERLESVGIFASSLTINPINNIDEERRSLEDVEKRLKDKEAWMDKWHEAAARRSEFKRDPDRMTPADLERVNARSSL